MGGKNKPEAATKRDANDDSTERLYRTYRRFLNEYGSCMPKELEAKFEEIRDEKNPGRLQELVLWEEVGPAGVRAIFHALRDTEYTFLRSVRCWRTQGEDEGVRVLVQFMRVFPTITRLELLECGVTELGCEFLGTLLTPPVICPLLSLKLDRNMLGNSGLAKLAVGVRVNSVLRELSLTYCGIDTAGARSLMEILIFQQSALESLSLQGNSLGNEGVSLLFHALQVNQVLLRLDIADNQFSDNEQVMNKLYELLERNKTLQELDVRLNHFGEASLNAVCELMRVHVTDSALSEFKVSTQRMPEELVEEFQRVLSANKRSKKGKKAGKKKKKK